MSLLPQTTEQRAWFFAITVALLGGLLFLSPYIGVIAFSILLAYLTNPVYKRIRRIKVFRERTGIAIALTLITTILFVGIPLTIAGILMAQQAVKLADSINLESFSLQGTSLNSSINQLVEKTNQIISGTTSTTQPISATNVSTWIQQELPKLIQGLANLILGIVSGIPNFFMMLILFVFTYAGLLAGRAKILGIIHDLIPFDTKTTNTYLHRIGAMCTAMVKGQLLIASLQGVVGALSLIPLGLGEYFFLFAILFTFLCMIPLGSGIILIPMGIISIALGQVVPGLIILGTHFLITTNIDNVLRPYLVPKDAHLPAALTLMSALAGVRYFGILGVIYGPVFMIVILTTIESYIAFQKQQQSSKTT